MGGCTSAPQNTSPKNSPAKKPIELSTEPSSSSPVPVKNIACDGDESDCRAPAGSESVIPDESQSDSDNVILSWQNSEDIQSKEKAPSPSTTEKNELIDDDGDATCCCYPSVDQMSALQISVDDSSTREFQIVIEQPKEEYEESERQKDVADETDMEGKAVEDAKLQKSSTEETEILVVDAKEADTREVVDVAECQENTEEDAVIGGERIPVLLDENHHVFPESAEVLNCCWSPFDDQSSLTQISVEGPSTSDGDRKAVEDAKLHEGSTECLVSNAEEDCTHQSGETETTVSHAENLQIVPKDAGEDKINGGEKGFILHADIDVTVAEGADLQAKLAANESEQQQSLVIEEGEKPMRSISEQVEDFYRVHNPSKLNDIPFILHKYAGKEDVLLEKLKLQYKVTKSEPPTYLERLENFYRLHKPDTLAKVPSILEKYKGRELELFDHLQKKYNSAPI